MNARVEEELKNNLDFLRKNLPVEDLVVFSFSLPSRRKCALCYLDGLSDKLLMSESVAKPLSSFCGEETLPALLAAVTLSEKETLPDLQTAMQAVLEGDGALFFDGLGGIKLGLRSAPVRTVTEPPTDLTLKGPRAGFVEDLKTNLALLRTRLKTPDLRFTTQTVGRRSNTAVSVCYLNGIAKPEVVKGVIERLKKIDVDGVPDSSYLSTILSERRQSLFKQTGTTEKPDVLAMKLLEGRVGLLVDGTPIAITVPYIIMEDLQSSDDYFVSPYRATATRLLRFFALIIAIYLPAFYVAAQLFKIQLLPIGLLLTVASNVQGLPLSPSMEMFMTMLVLEILTEASIHMPKYVGLSLSVVGALVLGEAAVRAGFLSMPAVLIVALSGICLYAVPNLLETTTVLRLVVLFLAGSVGIFGILLFTAFLLYYLFSTESYGAPLLAPFAPVVGHDLRDAILKYDLFRLEERPVLTRGKNKVRLKNDERN